MTRLDRAGFTGGDEMEFRPRFRALAAGAVLALVMLTPGIPASAQDAGERPVCLAPEIVQVQVEPGLGLDVRSLAARVEAAFLARLDSTDFTVWAAEPPECAEAAVPLVTVYLTAGSDLRLSLISLGVSLTVLDAATMRPVWGVVWVIFSSEDVDLLGPDVVRAAEDQVDLFAATWRPEALGASREPTSQVRAALNDEGVLRAYSAVLEQYRIDRGRFPADLAALEKNDPGGDPYFRDAATIEDAWGRPFHYQVSGDGSRAVVAGLGRDGIRGGRDSDRDIYVCMPDGLVVRAVDPDDRRDLLEVCVGG